MDDDSIKPKKSGDCYEKIAKGKSKEVDGPGVEDLEVLKNWIAQDPTDVEVWYPALRHQTFNTRFVPLSYDHTRVIVRFHANEMVKRDQDVIDDLEKSIDKCIQGFKAKGAFVRLSTLSPKDATLLQSKKLFDIMEEQLEGVSIDDQDHEIARINHAVYLASQVTTGKEAMEFFRLSGRVAGHLKNRLEQVKSPADWCMNIVVREWNMIKPEFEFRAFVYGGDIRAITHYYKFLFVEEIALCKKKIAELILDYFKAEVKHLVPLENYVIDFSVDHTAGYIKVIELNPWCDAASAALFNWDNPEEREIMMGKRPFQFRILERPKPGAFDGMPSQLRVMYWGIRPNAEKERAERSERTNSFILESPYPKLFKKILRTETKKYSVTLSCKPNSNVDGSFVNFERLFEELSINEYGIVHWIFSESFCEALGTEKTSQLSPKKGDFLRHFFATITALCTFMALSKEIPKKRRKVWDAEIASRAVAYLYYNLLKNKEAQQKGDDVEWGEAEVCSLFWMEVHNCLVSLTSRDHSPLPGLFVHKK